MPSADVLPHCLKLIRQARFVEARSILLPITKEHPGWARAHFYLGLTYQKEHRYETAVGHFRHALAADPQYAEIKPFLGWSLYYLGDAPGARRMFEEFLAVKPDYADGFFALGLLDFEADKIESAQARYERAIDLARGQQDKAVEAKSRARLADVLVRLERLEPAKQELEKSIELNPKNPEPYYKLWRVRLRLGDAEGAEQMRRLHEEVLQRRRLRESDPEANPNELSP